ncbi:MAG: hypothetical protein R3C56_26195 [Pirellulaceae bacterium]
MCLLFLGSGDAAFVFAATARAAGLLRGIGVVLDGFADTIAQQMNFVAQLERLELQILGCLQHVFFELIEEIFSDDLTATGSLPLMMSRGC